MALAWTSWRLTCPNCYIKGEATIIEITSLRRSTRSLYSLSPEYEYVAPPKKHVFDPLNILCHKCARTPVREATAFGEGPPPEPTPIEPQLHNNRLQAGLS
jgi:hypothetical protein